MLEKLRELTLLADLYAVFDVLPCGLQFLKLRGCGYFFYGNLVFHWSVPYHWMSLKFFFHKYQTNRFLKDKVDRLNLLFRSLARGFAKNILGSLLFNIFVSYIYLFTENDCVVRCVVDTASCETDEGRSKIMNSVKANLVKYSLLLQSDDKPKPILLDTKF